MTALIELLQMALTKILFPAPKHPHTDAFTLKTGNWILG